MPLKIFLIIKSDFINSIFIKWCEKPLCLERRG